MGAVAFEAVCLVLLLSGPLCGAPSPPVGAHFRELFGDFPISPRPVTDEDIAFASRWATYLYPLPRRFTVDVWVKHGPKWAENRFQCIAAPCNASTLGAFGIWYVDYSAEVPILMKLLAALRFVDDPERADLFLVPALIATLVVPHHPAVLAGYGREEAWLAELRDHLSFLTSTPAKPHLFLASRDTKLLPAWVNSQTHVVTLGPGTLVVPSLNPLATLQPRHHNATPAEERDVLVLAAFSLIYPIRELLHKQVMSYSGPAKVERQFFHGRTPGRGLMELMAHSVFVLCPPGDLPYQKRLFDTLLNGAIPVVIRRQCQDGPTWYAHLPAKYQHSCPAGNRLVNLSYPALPVSWPSLVVEVDLDVVRAPGFNIVQHLATLPKAEVAEKLDRIASARNWFVYDFDGTTPDAFSLLLRNVHAQLRLGERPAAAPPPAV